MKYIVNRWVTINQEIGETLYNPYYIAKDLWGGKIIDKGVSRSRKLPFYLGLSYWRYELHAGVYYPKPFHLVVRFIHWLDYWTVLPVGEDCKW